MSAQPLDIRMAHLEGAYEQVSQRLAGVEGRLGGLDAKIDALGRDLNAKIDSNADGLSRKIDSVWHDLNAKIDALARDLNAKMDKYFVMVVGLILISIILPIVRGASLH